MPSVRQIQKIKISDAVSEVSMKRGSKVIGYNQSHIIYHCNPNRKELETRRFKIVKLGDELATVNELKHLLQISPDQFLFEII